MITALNHDSLEAPRDSRAGEVLLIAGLGVAGLVVCGAAGWVAGQAETAIATTAGMFAAIVGGVVGWFAVTLLNRGNAPITAAPMMGMVIRLLVTAAGVGFCVLGAELERKPVIFSALFGYLLMMAAETYLLYRFASRSKTASVKPAASPEAAGPSRETPDR